MATRTEVIIYLLDQMSGAGAVTAKKMFGEYGLYCDAKLFGLVCDDRLYIKPTSRGREVIGVCEEGSPYPGAKPNLIVDEERWNDRAWLSRVVKATADDLPPSKGKKP